MPRLWVTSLCLCIYARLSECSCPSLLLFRLPSHYLCTLCCLTQGMQDMLIRQPAWTAASGLQNLYGFILTDCVMHTWLTSLRAHLSPTVRHRWAAVAGCCRSRMSFHTFQPCLHQGPPMSTCAAAVSPTATPASCSVWQQACKQTSPHNGSSS